jgi:hypothetical protein
MKDCRYARWFTLFVCALLIGCGKLPSRATVTGTVSLDGQPLSAGIIRFQPADGQTATAEAPITDGKFSALVPPGDKKISISAPKVTGKKRMYDGTGGPEVDSVQELLPVKYNVQTELRLTVTAGSQEKDFPLTSGK